MLSGKKILLTGGAGFIGSRLAARLVDQNEVVIFDSLHRNSLKDSGLAGDPRIRVIQGDVLDAPAVAKAAAGCTHVVHLAAIAGVDTVLKMPVETLKVNILGTLNTLDAASKPRLTEAIEVTLRHGKGTMSCSVSRGPSSSSSENGTRNTTGCY